MIFLFFSYFSSLKVNKNSIAQKQMFYNTCFLIPLTPKNMLTLFKHRWITANNLPEAYHSGQIIFCYQKIILRPSLIISFVKTCISLSINSWNHSISLSSSISFSSLYLLPLTVLPSVLFYHKRKKFAIPLLLSLFALNIYASDRAESTKTSPSAISQPNLSSVSSGKGLDFFPLKERVSSSFIVKR